MDAGVLYLNYIERLDACVGFEREAIGPERPNLNRMLIDGPILEERYEAGVEYVCRMVVEGYAAEEIRNRWREDIGLFCIQRKPSLLYEERPLFRSIREESLRVCRNRSQSGGNVVFLSDFSSRFEINFYICNHVL